ncbi:hypothetical protein LCM20_08060 [Halobacillus litoralis]|uniref:hypothetical protein n=1 Tax=Halobacillus litoralis TaxID=45668 RepID=UPI001CD3B041|nr:hypothetical protein [Halobacillus litoralis]MCA0970536.1 hypothetical protein [Halobacillus litoralis]
MEEFPIIHTNVWDALIAVPVVLILTQIIKKVFPVPKAAVPTIASTIGFVISIFFAHRHNLAAGLFMGAFYGNAAVGVYASVKTSIQAYRAKRKKKEPDAH